MFLVFILIPDVFDHLRIDVALILLAQLRYPGSTKIVGKFILELACHFLASFLESLLLIGDASVQFYDRVPGLKLERRSNVIRSKQLVKYLL